MVKRTLNRTLSKLYSRVKPSKRRFLPPEVWLEVFAQADLEIADIANVRLTCISFAVLGKARAFSSFHFAPFILVANLTHYRRPFIKEHATKSVQRLEYWASDDIAPLVRHCKVDPLYFSKEVEPLVDERDGTCLIDIFFQTLPRLFNLHRLECIHLPFCNNALNQLCQLKKLRTLEVMDCTVTASVPPQPALKVNHILFSSYCAVYGSVEERGSVGWLDILHPDPIRRICISLSAPKIIHLRGISTTRSLCDLSAQECDNVSRHIISILSHPSALEELKIFPYAKSEDTLEHIEPPNDYSFGALSLPSLRSYEGPPQFLSWVSTGPKLDSVKLTALDQSAYGSSGILLKNIQRETISDSIHSLTIHVCDVPDVLLMAIGARFIHIKELKIHAKRADEDQVSFSFRYFSSI